MQESPGSWQSRTRDRVSLLCNPPDVNPHGSFPRREHPSKTSCIANGSTTQHGGRLGHRRSFSGPSTAVKELIYTIAIVILPMKPKWSTGAVKHGIPNAVEAGPPLRRRG